MRYKITLSYDGAEFCGWQHQPSGNSVQDAVERAVFSLTGESVRVTGSGRTDAGVHALAQVAHFDTEKQLTERTVVNGLNAHLPRSVRVTAAAIVDESFDALRSVKKKTYMYLMYTGEKTPLLDGRALCIQEPDLAGMNAAAEAYIVGKHDFASFMAAGSGAKTTVRTVSSARFERDGRFIKFFVTADGFLYNMVRIMVAQLLRIGMGENVDLGAVLDARDRTLAKETAPACALYLYSVDYGEEL